MCRFKFEESINNPNIEYHMEISIWRQTHNIYDKNELKKIEIDSNSFENIFQRDYLINTLRKDISQFLPVFFTPNRTFVLYLSFHSFLTHFKYLDIYNSSKVSFDDYLKDITNNCNLKS
jgi:hypothetical protein